MENYVNNLVIDGIDELISEIKKSDTYKEYILLLDKVSKSNEINNLTKEIRLLNKQLVLTPSIKLEKELKEKEKKLNDIPLYLEFKYKLEELNNILIIIKNKIELFIKEDIILD